jgi:hypothetical protein
MLNQLPTSTLLRAQEVCDGSLEQMREERWYLFAFVRYMRMKYPEVHASLEIRNLEDDLCSEKSIPDAILKASLYVFIKDNFSELMDDSRWVLNFRTVIEYWEKAFVEGPLEYDDVKRLYYNSTGIVEEEIDQGKFLLWREQNGYIDMYPVLRNYMNKIEIALQSVHI